jgi:hypothetical protein
VGVVLCDGIFLVQLKKNRRNLGFLLFFFCVPTPSMAAKIL